MPERSPALDDFRREVMINVGLGMLELEITDDQGRHPVIVALDTEPLAALVRRISLVGGNANVFSTGSKGIRQFNFVRSECSLYEESADDMTREPPSGLVTVGAFVDYLTTQEAGVLIPAMLPSTESSRANKPRAVSFV